MSKIKNLEAYFKKHPEIGKEIRSKLRHCLIYETEQNHHSSNIDWLLDGRNNLEKTLQCIDTDIILRKQFEGLKKENIELVKRLEKKIY